MRVAAISLILGTLVIAPARASAQLSPWQYFVGTWSCSYRAGKTQTAYKAAFAYDMGGSWMRERDTWTGSGSDLGMFTYEPKRRVWTAVVLEQEGATVVFRASGSNPNHVVYRSVYPDASMTDVFDRDSPTRYTLHFTQSAGGKTVKSADTCVKT